MAYRLYAKVTGPGAHAGDGLLGGRVVRGFFVGEFPDLESLAAKKQEMRTHFDDSPRRYRFTVEEFTPLPKIG